jgi:hypothetical protein
MTQDLAVWQALFGASCRLDVTWARHNASSQIDRLSGLDGIASRRSHPVAGTMTDGCAALQALEIHSRSQRANFDN